MASARGDLPEIRVSWFRSQCSKLPSRGAACSWRIRCQIKGGRGRTVTSHGRMKHVPAPWARHSKNLLIEGLAASLYHYV